MKKVLVFVLFLISSPLFASELSYDEAVKLVKNSTIREFAGALKAGGYGVDDPLKGNYGRKNLLHIAMTSDNEDVAIWTIDNSENLNRPDYYGNTPLLLAISSGKEKYVKRLIEKKADLNLGRKLANTPIIYAAMKNRYEIAKLLVENGAKINIKVSQGYDLLYYLCRMTDSGSTSFMKYMMKYKPDLKRKYGYLKENALIVAAKYKNSEKVELLLKAGINVNSTNKSGNSALHYASMYNDEKTIELLVKRGADLFLKNRMGHTPLHSSIRYGKNDKIYIFSYYKDFSMVNEKKQNLLHLSITRNSESSFDYFLNNGADPEGMDYNMDRPLHYAARSRNTDFIDALMGRKVELNPKNKSGLTPLHYSFMRNNLVASRKLLEYGADPAIKDNSSRTPFDVFTGNRYVFSRVRRDSYLNDYFMKSTFAAEYSKRADEADRREWKKRRNKKIGNVLKYTAAYGLAVGHTAYAVYLNEEKYKDNPEDNPHGKGMSVVMGTVLGGAVGAFSLGALFVAFSDAKGLGQLGPMIIGGALGLAGGAVAGAYYGTKYREDFASNRALYYSSTALLSVTVPLIVINF